MIRVGVIGAAGKMGELACATVESTDGMELAATITEDDSVDDLASVDVAVDFTHPGVVMDHVAWCVAHDIDVVAGTSGFTHDRLETITGWLAPGPSSSADVGVLVVPNFSIGAVLMMRFAAEAARYFESVEIVELHHPTKLDAPSGTSIRTAQLIAAARARAGTPDMPDATSDSQLGARGTTVEGVPVHSVRARGLVAHQEVLLGSAGETLTIRHDMPDRVAAMAGLVASIRYVVDHPGLTVGLEPVLGLDATDPVSR
ncbi:MAG: 4-hydroxy-tetrahydrodipicolinate reductase [Nocardioidaceae bacterium]|nr:4-hydroxy-tetrahydrodipicolinate reductase [Nocardioidaceae bacterium]